MPNPNGSLAARIFNTYRKTFNGGQSLFLLLIRVYIGWQCALAGWGHLSHFHQTVDTFANDFHIAMPTVAAAVSGTTELVGGTLLLVGFLSRIVAFPLTINFIVAILSANLSDEKYRPLILHFWDNPDVILKDTAFPFFMTAVIVLIFGPGWFSIDGILSRWMGGRGAERP